MQTPTAEIEQAKPPASIDTRGHTSLERRLPLMIFGLLVVTIAAFGLLAFREVRQSLIAAANGQLRTIILQTGETAGRTLVQRATLLNAVRADSANHPRRFRKRLPGRTQRRSGPPESPPRTGGYIIDINAGVSALGGCPRRTHDGVGRCAAWCRLHRACRDNCRRCHARQRHHGRALFNEQKPRRTGR